MGSRTRVSGFSLSSPLSTLGVDPVCFYQVTVLSSILQLSLEKRTLTSTFVVKVVVIFFGTITYSYSALHILQHILPSKLYISRYYIALYKRTFHNVAIIIRERAVNSSFY